MRIVGLEDATSLAAHDLQQAVAYLGTLTELDDQRELCSRGLAGLAKLVPSDLLIYAEMEPESGWATWITHPPDILSVEQLDGYARWHESALYKEILCPLGIKYEMAVRMPWRGRMSVGVITGRRTADFTNTEKELLALVAAPLLRTAMRVRRRPVAAALLSGAELLPRDLLSEREREVLGHVAHGHTNASIARSLGVSPRTVDKHLEHIYRKLEVTGRVAAVRRLLNHQLPATPRPRAPLWDGARSTRRV